jgi:hypothetical protein
MGGGASKAGNAKAQDIVTADVVTEPQAAAPAPAGQGAADEAWLAGNAVAVADEPDDGEDDAWGSPAKSRGARQRTGGRASLSAFDAGGADWGSQLQLVGEDNITPATPSPVKSRRGVSSLASARDVLRLADEVGGEQAAEAEVADASAAVLFDMMELLQHLPGPERDRLVLEAASALDAGALEHARDWKSREGSSEPRGDTLLTSAARHGLLNTLAALLERCPALADVSDAYNHTALHVACAGGRLAAARGGAGTPGGGTGGAEWLDAVEALLRGGASVDVRDGMGCTALHYAAAAAERELAMLLLLNGASVNAADEGGSTSFDHATALLATADPRAAPLLEMLREHGGHGGSQPIPVCHPGQGLWGKLAGQEASKAAGSSEEGAGAAVAEGWEELWDPSAGHVYYYNNDTGESTWTLPSPLKQRQQYQHQDQHQQGEVGIEGHAYQHVKEVAVESSVHPWGTPPVWQFDAATDAAATTPQRASPATRRGSTGAPETQTPSTVGSTDLRVSHSSAGADDTQQQQQRTQQQKQQQDGGKVRELMSFLDFDNEMESRRRAARSEQDKEHTAAREKKEALRIKLREEEKIAEVARADAAAKQQQEALAAQLAAMQQALMSTMSEKLEIQTKEAAALVTAAPPATPSPTRRAREANAISDAVARANAEAGVARAQLEAELKKERADARALAADLEATRQREDAARADAAKRAAQVAEASAAAAAAAANGTRDAEAEAQAAQMQRERDALVEKVRQMEADSAARLRAAEEADRARASAEHEERIRLEALQAEKQAEVEAVQARLRQREADASSSADALAQLRREAQTREAEAARLQAELVASAKSAESERAAAAAATASARSAKEDAERRMAEQQLIASSAEAAAADAAAAREQMQNRLRIETKMRKKYLADLESLKGAIRVLCRVRPLSNMERKKECAVITESPEPGVINVRLPEGSSAARVEAAKTGTGNRSVRTFEFDVVFGPESSQAEVFAEVKPLVQQAVDGFNVCIFAYGQTGSGKTFTMSGEGGDGTLLGLMPRAVYEMYSILERHSEDVEASVQFCMTELYKDHLEDLLLEQRPGESNSAFTQRRPELKVKMDPNGIVFIDGVTMADAPTAQELQQLIEAGTAHRHTSATLMNAESSRSHLLMSVYIRSRNKATRVDTVGKLTLVDLAGSERMGKSGVTGDAAKEAVSINKSLSALGDVIGALTKGAKHVPYRNHTLTRLMQDSLGGNAKTLMVVNCSPADYNFDETQNSLAYVPASAHIRHPWCAIA